MTNKTTNYNEEYDRKAFRDEQYTLNYVESFLQKGIDESNKTIDNLQEQVSNYEFNFFNKEDRRGKEDVKRRSMDARDRRTELVDCRSSLYFGRLDLETDQEKDVCYIGWDSVELGNGYRIVRWETPVGDTYYNSDAIYNEKYGYTVLLRREIEIKNQELKKVNTTYDKENSFFDGDRIDAFLLGVLKDKRRNYELTDIIRTIQKEQNRIIRRPFEESFIVQGAAGSGKTMVLLHRLAFLLYNYPDESQSYNYCVLTPNEMFNGFIDNLTIQLKIGNIQRYTMESFYEAQILLLSQNDTKEIIIREGSTNTRRVPKIEKTHFKSESERMPNKALLRELYSEAFFDGFIKAYREQWNHILNELKKIDGFKYIGLGGMIQPNEQQGFAQYTAIKTAVNKMIDSIDSYKKATPKIPEAKKKLGEAEDALSKERARLVQELTAKINAASDGRYNLSERELFVMNIVLKEFNDNPEPVDLSNRFNFRALLLKEEDEAFEKSIKEYKTRYSSYINDKNSMDKLSNQVRELESMRFIVDNKHRLDELRSGLERIKKIAAGLDIESFIKWENEQIKKLYSKYGEAYQANKGYRHIWIYKLLLCALYYGQKQKKPYHISVDEAQDVSYIEYRLLRMILGDDVIMNLYGDTRQLVYDYKGISNWRTIYGFVNSRKYELNENFRNTSQVNGYCNNEFGMNVKDVGINGEVVIKTQLKDAISGLLKVVYKIPGGRFAIISVVGKKIVERTLKEVDISDEDRETILKRVKILSVEESKGLEFESVLVIVSKDMTKNEKYVSYTRALDNLIITRLPPKPKAEEA